MRIISLGTSEARWENTKGQRSEQRGVTVGGLRSMLGLGEIYGSVDPRIARRLLPPRVRLTRCLTRPDTGFRG